MENAIDDPIDRFAEWLRRAHALDRAILPEPTAFALATVSEVGRPSVRMLLLKDVDERGFVFYTNLLSRKVQDLRATEAAAMCFHWAPLDLQVRVEGGISQVDDEEADSYFVTRPRVSQLGAWASLQSSPMEDDEDLEARLRETERRFEGVMVPRPPHWSGFRLRPESMEFWTGRPFRLHQRELYTRSSSGWTRQLLYP